MPVPFQDIASGAASVRIAYLRFVKEAESKGIRGCMFVISQQGDPLEFCCTRVDLPSGSLWNQGVAVRRAVTELTKALFQAVRLQPDVVFCLSFETPQEVFSEDIDAQVPVCCVSSSANGDLPESVSDLRKGKSVSLCWQKELDSGDYRAGPVIQYLESRDRLLEPFERAGLGLEEAFYHP